MKKILLFILAMTTITANAQTFEWGPAEWNIQDGWVFNDQADFDQTGVILTYPNPSGFSFTMLHMLGVTYDLYIDDATEPIEEEASGRAGTEVRFSYPFVEGHKYKIVTKSAQVVFVNLATMPPTPEVISTNEDSYSISFEIKGPELVSVLEVEETMSLAITDQYDPLTATEIDITGIKESLGISDISEATIYGVQMTTGQYVPHDYYASVFDGWRDNDGDYTNWGGGWNSFVGGNAYPAVYCVKISEDADSLTYFFYDYWKEYDPEEDGEIGGGTVTSKQRAPETSYNSVIWDWDNGDGTITQYRRSYRCNEGQDYKASFIITANKKYVQINATLHFVSIEDYEKYIASVNSLTSDESRVIATEIFSISGARLPQTQPGINIVKKRLANGTVKTQKILVK